MTMWQWTSYVFRWILTLLGVSVMLYALYMIYSACDIIWRVTY